MKRPESASRILDNAKGAPMPHCPDSRRHSPFGRLAIALGGMLLLALALASLSARAESWWFLPCQHHDIPCNPSVTFTPTTSDISLRHDATAHKLYITVNTAGRTGDVNAIYRNSTVKSLHVVSADEKVEVYIVP